MSSPSIAPPLAGQVIGSGSDSFVLAEWKDDGAPSGPPRLIAPLHLHHHDDETWYVLEGKLCVQVGEQVVEAEPGAAVFVHRGTPHTYWNPDSHPVRYLLIMTSNIYRLIEEIHATPDRNPAVLKVLFEKHGSELINI
jgi:mannose-6-phosphate isomerase-like protein (cupin superfamily)